MYPNLPFKLFCFFSMNSLDKQFIRIVKDFRQTVMQDGSQWNSEDIIKFGIKKSPSLARKPAKNLKQSCLIAMEYLTKADSAEDDAQTVADAPNPNLLNDSLSVMYQCTKKRKTEISTTAIKTHIPAAKLSDVGGMDTVIQKLLELIGLPLLHPEIFTTLGVDPPRGLLLYGPPGTGKTMIANAIANEINVPFISVAAPVIVSGMSGESEKKLRELFEEAKSNAPCILFIDEIDAITPKRETAQREMERRIVAQFLTCMDDISLEKTGGKPVIIIGATNRPDSLDKALRRAGRFDKEIGLGVPDEMARSQILEKMCQRMKLTGNIDFKSLAKITPGYVGADLNSLVAEAGMIGVKRIFETFAQVSTFQAVHGEEMNVDATEPQINMEVAVPALSILKKIPKVIPQTDLDSLSICFEDFQKAVTKVQPSSIREGFATVSGVSWDDIGALETVRDELRMAVVNPILHPEAFGAVGIKSSSI